MDVAAVVAARGRGAKVGPVVCGRSGQSRTREMRTRARAHPGKKRGESSRAERAAPLALMPPLPSPASDERPVGWKSGRLLEAGWRDDDEPGKARGEELRAVGERAGGSGRGRR